MSRVYNFGAGPAMLPLEVMQRAQAEFLDWRGLGVSVMEISHRSEPFQEMAAQVEADFRELLHIPPHYRVLFMAGGGQGQFALVPMNLLGGSTKAAYVNFGQWGSIAIEVAKRYCEVKVVADTAAGGYKSIMPVDQWAGYHDDSAYLYCVDNETVDGVEFSFIPETGAVPLVSDMSSNLLSRHFDINKYGLVFACAQKNLGPAGITIVIVREDLLERAPLATTPPVFCYHKQAEKNSLLHTPPTYSWYMVGLVLEWLKAKGGVAVMQQQNLRKAQKLYHYIDNADFYYNDIDKNARSRLNVIFRLHDDSLDVAFLQQAEQQGLRYLKGHRFVGGMRASMYNAMPEAGVDCLIEFMQDFAARHGG